MVGNRIGRITPAGDIIEFPLPTANSGPNWIAGSSNGSLWFTETQGNKIGRITPAGVITEFPLPSPSSSPSGITAGPDGNLWFTEMVGNRIGRITPAGVITEFPLPRPNSFPVQITIGPDGHLWFTEADGDRIGRITVAGVISEFPLPGTSQRPLCIAAGPDSNLWFTEGQGHKIGQITLAASFRSPPSSLAARLSSVVGGACAPYVSDSNRRLLQSHSQKVAARPQRGQTADQTQADWTACEEATVTQTGKTHLAMTGSADLPSFASGILYKNFASCMQERGYALAVRE